MHSSCGPLQGPNPSGVTLGGDGWDKAPDRRDRANAAQRPRQGREGSISLCQPNLREKCLFTDPGKRLHQAPRGEALGEAGLEKQKWPLATLY